MLVNHVRPLPILVRHAEKDPKDMDITSFCTGHWNLPKVIQYPSITNFEKEMLDLSDTYMTQCHSLSLGRNDSLHYTTKSDLRLISRPTPIHGSLGRFRDHKSCRPTILEIYERSMRSDSLTQLLHPILVKSYPHSSLRAFTSPYSEAMRVDYTPASKAANRSHG